MKTVLGIILLIAIYSCDTRKDVYLEGNVAPVLSVELENTHSAFSGTQNGNTITDTLKKGFDYKFSIKIEDENTGKFEFEGAGQLFLFGVEVTASELNPGTYSFKWKADTLGLREFKIKYKDAYGVETIKSFKIHVFENRLPVVDWTLVHVGNIDPLEKQIIVSGQDGDQLYGGYILYYQFVIGADTTNNPTSNFNYVFPSAGNYTISVRAYDSNNEWGNPSTVVSYLIN